MRQRAPDLDGRVEHIDGPHMERGHLALPAAMGGLGYVINPLVGGVIGAILGQKGQVSVRFLRIHDRVSGHVKSAKMRGEPSGSISVGDQVQVWGRLTSGGTLEVQLVYNETTGEIIKSKT